MKTDGLNNPVKYGRNNLKRLCVTQNKRGTNSDPFSLGFAPAWNKFIQTVAHSLGSIMSEPQLLSAHLSLFGFLPVSSGLILFTAEIKQ